MSGPSTDISTSAKPKDRLGHKTMALAVADALRSRILAGDLAPGMQLRQDALALEFGISRIPIREALLQLEAGGLVHIMPHKGAVVSSLSVQEIDDIFQLRMQIEPSLLILSAHHFTPQDYRELHEIRDEYSSALKAGRVAEWGELNRRFHLGLLRHADRPKSLKIISGLLQDCDRPTRQQLSITGDLARADMEHSQILALCEAREYGAAANLLRSHIEHAGQSLMKLYSLA